MISSIDDVIVVFLSAFGGVVIGYCAGWMRGVRDGMRADR